MNCHYCTYPIEDGSPFVPVAKRRPFDPLTMNALAHLACAIANVNTVQAHPDKSGKWCDYYHQPTGKWCMLPPHGDEKRHVMEDEKATTPTDGHDGKRN